VSRKAEQAILVISDTHIGRWTPSYDYNGCVKKLQSLTEKVCHLLSHHHPHIDTLHLFLLGDIVEGEAVYKSQAYNLDVLSEEAAQLLKGFGVTALPHMPVIAQSYLAAILLCDYLIMPLSQHMRSITVRCVAGNHGRLHRLSPLSNMDLTAGLLLNLLLSGKRGINLSVTLHPLGTLMGQTKVLGHTIVYLHDAEFRAYQGIPFYAVVNKVLRWKAQGAIPQDTSLVIIGHFHVAFFCNIHPRILVNGTFVEGDIYPLVRLGLCPSVSQWLIGVTPDRCPSFMYEIDLSEGKPPLASYKVPQT
jgi:hypothetical protein